MNKQRDVHLDAEKSVEPNVGLDTTATANEINLQGCKDIQKTDVTDWLATDDLAYCITDLDDIEIILMVNWNAANEPQDTKNSESDTEESFLKVTHSEDKEELEMALHYIEEQKK